MNFKITNSAVFNKDIQIEKLPDTERQAWYSSNSMSVQRSTRLRMPLTLQSAIKKQARMSGSHRASKDLQQMKGSGLGGQVRNSIVSTFKMEKDNPICQICETEMRTAKKKKKMVYMAQCPHKNNFCQSCLHHYVIYKVKNFQQVICPEQNCSALLDTNTTFFKNLPADVQKNYKKIHQFQTVLNDSNSKLCPRQKCQGVIRGSPEGAMTCDTCKDQFCGKCLLSYHSGECDQQQLLFFQQNLHYRQCKKCGLVIEKDQGCNHMTCRCRHQFCYVCGKPWSSKHYGDHDQNGNVTGPEGVQYYIDPNDECGNCCCCCRCQCGCLDDCCCGFVIKAIFKGFLLVFLCLAMVLIFVCRDMLIWVVLVVASIITGIFCFSFEFICDQEGVWCILAAIFLPVSMIVGVGIAFRDVFWEVATNMCQETNELFQESLDGIQAI